MISTNPVTIIRAVSFNVSCQTLPRPGSAYRKICGIRILTKIRNLFIPTDIAASICPRGMAKKAPLITSVEYAPDIAPTAMDPITKALSSI